MKSAKRILIAHLVVAGAALLTSTQTGAAEAYPSKPIRVIVGTVPGGATDLTTRLVANKMSEKLGQQIIVENKPGADTMVATRYVKEQPADGYTILAQSVGFSTLPYVKLDPGYSLRDFTGVGMMTRVPFLMLVGTDEPVRSLADYVDRAKKVPLSYGHGGVASAPQIAAETFLRAYSLDVQAIPYKGNGAVMPDVVAGRVSMFFDAYISSASFVKGGRMRALAVAAPQRLSAAPDVPTFKEQGLDFSYSVWLGLVARAGTPQDVVDRLSDALRFALGSKDLADRFRADGAEPTFLTPKDFTAFLAKDFADMAKVASDLNFVKE
jgi:tripartite-type tricarboxylate transporter receptor subunit TctC